MCQDSADSAQNYKCDVQHGDIIITATDGMFDNLFQFEILKIIKNFKEEQIDQVISTSH